MPPPTRAVCAAWRALANSAVARYSITFQRRGASRNAAGVDAADQDRVAPLSREVERADLLSAPSPNFVPSGKKAGEEVGLAVHHALALDQRLGRCRRTPWRRSSRPTANTVPSWSRGRRAGDLVERVDDLAGR